MGVCIDYKVLEKHEDVLKLEQVFCLIGGDARRTCGAVGRGDGSYKIPSAPRDLRGIPYTDANSVVSVHHLGRLTNWVTPLTFSLP